MAELSVRAARWLTPLGGAALGGAVLGVADGLLGGGPLGVCALAGCLAGLFAGGLLAPLATWLKDTRGRWPVVGLTALGAGLGLYLDARLYVGLYPELHELCGWSALLLASLAGAMALPARLSLGLSFPAVALSASASFLGPLLLGEGEAPWQALAASTTLARRMSALWPAPEAEVSELRCQWPLPAPAPAGGLARGANLLLITVDALRGDLAGDRLAETLPQTAALLGPTRRFDRGYAAVTRTNESVYTLLTGRYAHRLGFVKGGVDAQDRFRHAEAGWTLKQGHPLPLTDRTPTLAGILRQAGYHTATFPPYVFFLPGAGITREFEHIDATAYERRNRDNQGITGDLMTERALAWLATAPEPFFMWTHYLDPHHPYHAFEVSDDAPASARYASELKRADAQVAALLTALGPKRAHTVVILAADHGEAFGEHGAEFHGTSVYEEQARVPIYLSAPSLARGVSQRPVSLVDIAPTALDLLGISSDARFDGQSLLSDTLRPVLTTATLYGLKAGVVAEFDGGLYKLMVEPLTGRRALFELLSDPGERENLIDKRPEVRDTLACWLTSSGVLDAASTVE